MLGYKFRTDMVIFRCDLDTIDGPIIKNWNTREFNGAAAAWKESIVSSMIKNLNLMNREITGGYRKIVRNNHRYLDVFVYDAVPGGAGLVTEIKQSPDLLIPIFENSFSQLNGEKCTGSNPCDISCTGCLLDFRNKREHNLMNRPLGYQLALYLKEGRSPRAQDFALNSERDIIQEHVEDLQSFFEDSGEIKLNYDEKLTPNISIRNDEGDEAKVWIHSPIRNQEQFRKTTPVPILQTSESGLKFNQISLYDSMQQFQKYENILFKFNIEDL